MASIGYFGVCLTNITNIPGYSSWFTYNGYSISLLLVPYFQLASGFFGAYINFETTKTNFNNSPLLLWLIICTCCHLFKGAVVLVNSRFCNVWHFAIDNDHQKWPSPFLLLFLALPAIVDILPLWLKCSCSLGLRWWSPSTLLTSLTLFLIAPSFWFDTKQKRIGLFVLYFWFGVFFAHLDSDFKPWNAKPTSLSMS